MAHSVVSTALTMDISQMTAGVQAAVQNLDKLNATSQKTGRDMAKALKGINFLAGLEKLKLLARAGAASFKALTDSTYGFIDSQLAFVKSQFDVAYSLGLTYNQLQGLSLAAQNAGLSFERIYEPMSKVARKIDDALKGSALSIQNFQRLGLDPQFLIGLSQYDQFKVVVDAINAIENSSERAALAMNLFEESGGKFLQLFATGSVGLAAFENEAKKLGLTLTDLQLGKLLDANKAIISMKNALSGLKTQVLATVGPTVEKIANLVTDFLSQDKLREQLGDLFREWVQVAIKSIAYAIDFVGRFIGSMSEFLDKSLAIVRKIDGVVVGFSDLLDTISVGVQYLGNQWARAQGAQIPQDAWLDSPAGQRLARPVGRAFGDIGQSVQDTLNGLTEEISNYAKGLVAPPQQGQFRGVEAAKVEEENTVAVRELTRATQQNTQQLLGLAGGDDIRTAGGLNTLLSVKADNFGQSKQVKLLEKIVEKLEKANQNKPAPELSSRAGNQIVGNLVHRDVYEHVNRLGRGPRPYSVRTSWAGCDLE